MRLALFTPIVLISSLSAGVAFAQAANPPDGQPVTIGGIETVCTGTTKDAREDPRWRDYSLRLEFVGRDGHYLGDETVTLTGGSRSLSVHCDGPWVLMKLPPGSYRMVADVAEAGRREMTVPGRGQVIVRFPQAGGEGSIGRAPEPAKLPDARSAYTGQ